MHDYLADLKFRLVESFGGEPATEMRKSPRVALVTGAFSDVELGSLRYNKPGNGLPAETSHHP